MGYRQKLIKLFTFLGGIYFFLEFVLPKQIGEYEFGKYSDEITTGFMAVFSMAIGLGLINLFSVHGSRIVFRRKGYRNSIALLGGLIAMLVITTQDWLENRAVASKTQEVLVLRDFASRIEKDYSSRTETTEAQFGETASRSRIEKLLAALDALLKSVKTSDLTVVPDPDVSQEGKAFDELKKALEKTQSSLDRFPRTEANFQVVLEALGTLRVGTNDLGLLRQDFRSLRYKSSSARKRYDLLNEGLFLSLGTAMFSLLAFYMAAAAYRAFRIRSLESALMMSAAILVMLGQIPFGIWLWDGFPEVRLWLLSTPSTAAFRAIKFGAAIAGLIMALRMWFSLESETFGKKPR